jgi:hypothetical protein
MVEQEAERGSECQRASPPPFGEEQEQEQAQAQAQELEEADDERRGPQEEEEPQEPQPVSHAQQQAVSSLQASQVHKAPTSTPPRRPVLAPCSRSCARARHL